MRFVGIFQYFWMYQNPSVDAVDVTAWERPRYVLYRNENWNLSFWQIETSVPVVLSPSERRKNATR
jgi:hypothetical protein